MTSVRPEISVVIPTYRGAAALPELVGRLTEELGRLADRHEIVIVNDASPDTTWEVLTELAGRFPQLRAVELLTNGGQAQATLCGLDQARGEVVVTMDDDLQHPPECIGTLVGALRDDLLLDAVVGAWGHDQGFSRDLGTRVHGAVNRIAYGSPRRFRHTAFRAIRRPVVDAMLRQRTMTPVVSSLLWQTTRRIRNVQVEHHAREHGRSNFQFRHGIRAVVRNFFQASTLPLRFLTTFGFVSAVLAFLTATVFLVRWLAGVQTPPGWTSAFLLTAFFGGTTVFGIGLLGEYVGLILKEVRGRPGWDVRSRIEVGRVAGHQPDDGRGGASAPRRTGT